MADAAHWRGPLLRALLLAALVCAVAGVAVYFLARGSRGPGGSMPGPPGEEAPGDDTPPAGSSPPFFWELPASLAGIAEPVPCEWPVTSDALVALGPTARRSGATVQRVLDGRVVLWRGKFDVETGWCGFAARVDGDYTRQPQVRRHKYSLHYAMWTALATAALPALRASALHQRRRGAIPAPDADSVLARPHAAATTRPATATAAPVSTFAFSSAAAAASPAACSAACAQPPVGASATAAAAQAAVRARDKQARLGRSICAAGGSRSATSPAAGACCWSAAGAAGLVPRRRLRLGERHEPAGIPLPGRHVRPSGQPSCTGQVPHLQPARSATRRPQAPLWLAGWPALRAHSCHPPHTAASATLPRCRTRSTSPPTLTSGRAASCRGCAKETRAAADATRWGLSRGNGERGGAGGGWGRAWGCRAGSCALWGAAAVQLPARCALPTRPANPPFARPRRRLPCVGSWLPGPHAPVATPTAAGRLLQLPPHVGARGGCAGLRVRAS